MGKYEEWHDMKTTDMANKIRGLNDSAITQLIESIIVMIDSGHYPREAFHEVKWVGRLLYDLKVGHNVEAN